MPDLQHHDAAFLKHIFDAAATHKPRAAKPPLTATALPRVLRDYQQLALELTLAAILRGERCFYLSLPTGCGKGEIIGALAAARRSRGRVLVICHRDAIINEPGGLADRLRKWCGLDKVGVVMGARDETAALVAVASVQTLSPKRGLWRRLDRLLADGPIATVVIDECHHAAIGNTYDEICDRLGDIPVIGFTATPRPVTAKPPPLFDACVFARETAEMVAAGWLVPPLHQQVIVPLRLAELVCGRNAEGEDDWTDASVSVEAMRPAVVSALVEGTALAIGKRKALVFAASVEHARALAVAYTAADIRAASVWGSQDKDERRATLDAFAAGRLLALANYGVLTEGFDAPDVSAIVMARPTKSFLLYKQMLGRGLRLFPPDKKNCLVLEAIPPVPNPSQVTLRAVVPAEIDEDIDDEDDDFPLAPDDGGEQRPPRPHLYLLDPRLAGKWNWRGIAADGGAYYVTALADVRIYLVRDPRGSGLWRFGLIDAKGGNLTFGGKSSEAKKVYSFTTPPSTLERVQEVVGRWLLRRGNPRIGNRDSDWRSRRASPRMMGYLRDLAHGLYDDRVLTAHQAGNAIDDIFARRELPRVAAALWENS